VTLKDESIAVATPAATGAADQGRPAAVDAAGAANLDKVRDILFGVQMREFERRFARLEDRLVKETNDLKDDVKKRLEALESYARQESEALAAQLRTEQEARSEAHRDLSRELNETAKAFERRSATLDEQLAKGQRESRQQLLEQYQRLSDEIRTKMDDVLATLAREAHELRTDKADRAVLASLLSEMALRLTNGLTIPGAEELGNG
jgi:DNA anti-recombination protein RmuC